jgi:hypothetical protein
MHTAHQQSLTLLRIADEVVKVIMDARAGKDASAVAEFIARGANAFPQGTNSEQASHHSCDARSHHGTAACMTQLDVHRRLILTVRENNRDR